MEFVELEREVALVRPRRVLDAGSGEGGVAMALGARHPELEVDRYFPPASFDLVYSFAVLEHVRDVDETVRAIEAVLRPGGRFAFVVPMHELRVTGPIPDYTPLHGYADHCRVFTEAELRERFGRRSGFRLTKLPGEWKHGELPDCFEPIEFGAFFVSYARED